MLKRRAPRACLSCRSQKIKCDFLQTGNPCSNCSRSKTQCSVVLARKQRVGKHAKTGMIPESNTHTFEVDLPHEDGFLQSGLSGSVNNALDLETASNGCHMVASLPWLPSDIDGNEPQGVLGAQSVPDAEHAIVLESLFHPEDPSQDQPYPYSQLDLPGYIAELPSGLDPEVLRFLRNNGALVIPTSGVTEELLRAYVCYVHPFMPLLDIGPFIRAVDSDGENNRISLLLFQAVMFAGVTFVNQGSLERAGFQSHHKARTTFFDRVKLLYNADTESDPTTLIQVLLLMTCYHEQPRNTKGSRHFLSAALCFAADIGLDGSFELESLPLAYRKFRRRLWSCCLTIDKFVSMSECRAACIRPGNLNTSTLQLDDLNDTDLSDALDRYYMRDRETDARILRKLSIMNAKLYALIDRILDMLYIPTIHSGNLTINTKTVLVPKTSSRFAPDCMAFDQDLRKWYVELSTTEGSNVSRDHRRNGRVVGVHSAMVEMLYNTALILVHRPHVSLNHPENSGARSLQGFSKTVTKEAARRITNIAIPLQEGNLLRFLPPVGVTALLTAAREHISDARPGGNTAISSEGRWYLDQTKMLLVHLQSVYGSAEWAVRLVESICTTLFSEHGLEAGNSDGDMPASQELLNTGFAAELLFSGRLDIADLEESIDRSVVR